ncbi:hypothetical protein HJC23_011062 [Cyclotella cryptica]|uniref:Uncharacterized protein n=1 Tax=Cyclotella cryptica TaxID=29204 RepID=A0ABD3PBH3_9STRA
MAHQPPVSPDARKKKPALPSLLSNLRNAQAAIVGGVTAGNEGRPLIGVSGTNPSKNGNGIGGSSYAADRSNMKRSIAAATTSVNTRPPSVLDPSPSTRINTGGGNVSASLSSTLTSLSLRFENSWRKRNQHLHKEDDSVRHNNRRRRPIRVSIPQSFLVSSLCFFVGVPLLVLLYVLARKSVFGDEGAGEVGGVSEHKYEVKAFDINGEFAEEPPTELDKLQDLDEVDKNSGAVNFIGSDSLGVDPLNEQGDSNGSNQDKAREGTVEGAPLQHSDQSQDNAGNLRGYQSSNIDIDNKLESADFASGSELHSTSNNTITDLIKATAVVPEQSANILGINPVNDEEKDKELIGGVESLQGNTNDGDEDESV